MKLVGVGVLCFAAACGNDVAVDPGADAPQPIDGPQSDAPPDAPACFGEGSYQDRGEVRVELVHRTDGTTAARATAFVYADLGAPRHQWINLDGCTDVSALDHWPFDNYPAATYQDPGQVLISGGAQPLQLTPQTAAGVDAMGRPHPANTWFVHDGGDDGAQYLPPDTRLTATFTGSTNLPGSVYTDALYVPPTFDLTSPGMAPVVMPTATALTFTSTNPAAVHKVPGYNVVSSVVFSGPNGPAVVCTKPADGSLTVPPAMVDLVRAKYPTGGTLIRETSETYPLELQDGNEPHLDTNGCPANLAVFFTGANRYESTFTVEP